MCLQRSLLIFVTLLLSLILPCHGANILFLLPASTHSETHFFEPLIHQVSLQHNVTVVSTAHSSKLLNVIEQVVPLTAQELFGSYGTVPPSPENVFKVLYYDSAVNELGPALDAIYESQDFKRVVIDKLGTYDLVFVNFLMGQAFYGIVHLNKSPFIILNSFPCANYLTQDLGNYAPPSTLPFPTFLFSNRMTFWERLVNQLVDWSLSLFNYYRMVPFMESVYRRHLGEDLPSIWDIQKNASLIMTNTHFTSTYHRPLNPDVVEIGGIHCRMREPLTKEIQTFLGTSSFIYVSFGTIMQSSTVPHFIVKKLFSVFATLASRDIKVVMKLELTKKDKKKLGVPKNVLLGKWFEQQDLLGHPKLLLFISHGGLLSTQQAICHAVPALFIPYRFDQRVNTRHAVNQGYALSLDYWEFTEVEVEGAIDQLVEDPRENAKRVSQIFKDQPKRPIETALYWSNYVLKHKGAPHLRSSARQLNYFQFHNYDVIALVLVFVGLVFFVILKTVVYIVKRILRRRDDRKESRKKVKKQ